MILKEKKYFQGVLNADDADFVITDNQYINAENVRFGTTDAGVIGTMESIGSTEMLSAPLPSITFISIGSVSDEENSRFCTFYLNVHGPHHKIECYYSSTNTIYTVILSSQVVGGLNFSKRSFIHSAKIINGLLYWVDDTNNEPRKINIEAAIKANNPSFITDEVPYNFPINFSEITIIKPPPPLAPNINKITDSSFLNNFIANDSFQFAFQYQWYDGEQSVIGTYSPASRLNTVTDTFNAITVSMDILEVIPDTVEIVNLIVRIDNENNAKIINTWDKNISSEATEIANQNAGIAQLTFNFYNNLTGPSIAKTMVLKPFDSVPIFSETLESARNRIFLANNIEGYDTPTNTSLSCTLQSVTLTGNTLNALLFSIEWRYYRFLVFPNCDGFSYSSWAVYLGGIPGISTGWYVITSTEQLSPQASLSPPIPYPTLPAMPTTVTYGGLSYKGITDQDALNNTGFTHNTVTYPFQDYAFLVRFGSYVTITGLTVTTYNIFKTRSSYRVGIVFYDFAMRKCGVVTNDSLLISIPGRNYNFTTGISSIIWNLSNSNAVVEIPEWAYYYTPVRTLNLKTRYFISAFDNAAKYATKDVNGNYQFVNTTFVNATVGIGINTTALVQAGLGYVFNEGDICILIRNDDAVYELPVIGQSGNFIIIKAQDVGDLSTNTFIYEIYTPYQASVQEPFYEVGEMYRILNPGTSVRSYETLTGVFLPDVYAITRNYNAVNYFAEAMSPNDLLYQKWYTDAGKPNFITKLGQQRKENSISWSNVFIPGTQVNGLSTFDALDEIAISEDCGPIRKLILTSKVQSEGTVMLAVCTNETNSLYLGESQIIDSTGATQFFTQSTNVISTINILKGSFGTINPESVIEYRGNVWFYDANNGRYIQYASNGLFPISVYKMTRFWKLFSELYKSLNADQIEALGARPFVFSTIDPHHNELLISIPELSNIPPKGYLPDYPNTIYPFDIWDAQGKTIVFNLNGEPRWQGAYSFNPECFVTLQNQLYSFKNGNLYIHNQTSSYNNFYGVQYSSKIMFIANHENNRPKVYDNISIESNMQPSFAYFYANYPYQQSSDLVDFDFKDWEGVFYATLYRNKLIPTATGFNTDGLLTGQKMRTAALYILIEFSINTIPLELKFVNMGYSISRGHTT